MASSAWVVLLLVAVALGLAGVALGVWALDSASKLKNGLKKSSDVAGNLYDIGQGINARVDTVEQRVWGLMQRVESLEGRVHTHM